MRAPNHPPAGPDVHSAPLSGAADVADWIVEIELDRPFPMRGGLGVGLVCTVSLMLWGALVWALVGALG